MFNRKSAVFIITSCFVVYIVYINFHDNVVFYRINIDLFIKDVERRKPIYIYKGTEDYLINTIGCYIPNYGKTLVFKESRVFNLNCGERAIFLNRIENDQIAFQIDTKKMNKYSQNNTIFCYYRFASRSNITGKEDTLLSYTEWEPFKNLTKITLKEEIIVVICATSSKTNQSATVVYEDAYMFVKRLRKLQTITENWNVLMIGMDTMSRARAFNSMPNTVQYLKRHDWLDYKGYQKVGYNTFPNLMAVLTGKKLNTIYKECASGMHKCNDLIIWTRFREAGYITAYGEDNLRLPDTFFRYKGFQTPPTHHYLRPFFLTGEKQKGNLICAKHKPSAKHMLDYANEYSTIYKKEKFFGMFWINSYSHNLNNIPSLLDDDMVSFFEQLNKSGVLNNTIVIFFSDHGIRFGKMRIPVESYYEERLPMLFAWIPHEFRKIHEEKYYNLQLNQNRLVTPYDVYVTLAEISNTLNKSDNVSEACPQCTSLFEEKSEHRTCDDGGVSDKWCSCNVLAKVDTTETGPSTSLKLAVKYIQNITNSIRTIDCMACSFLQMNSVLRSHSYKSRGEKSHYVVAWQMSPGNVSFEATVVEEDNGYTILQPTDTISAYNVRGNCVKNPNDRPFCVCRTTKCTGDNN